MAGAKEIQGKNGAHLQRVERLLSSLQKAYNTASKKYIELAKEADYDPSEDDGQFYFDSFSELKMEAKKITSELALGIEQVVLNGTSAEWAKGNDNADGVVNDLLTAIGKKASDKISDKDMVKWFNNHEDALNAFQKRKIGGLGLSKNVWNLADHFKIEHELARSISDGVGADELSRFIRDSLNEPDKLFRRVRDKYGVLRLSKNAKTYQPGPGTYRSSYKNAVRLARTEINMAYRSAEIERYGDFDFVVGYEVKRSGNPYDCPICEALAGRYPKTFKFSGWHPNCRCFIVPILISDEEMDKRRSAILAGADEAEIAGVLNESEGQIEDTDSGLYSWMSENRKRILDAKAHDTLPYFFTDNSEFFELPIQILEVMEKASSAGKAVQSLAEEIADKFGATVTPINYKTFASIRRKCLLENCTPDKLKDTVRTTIVCERKYIDEVRKVMSKRKECLRLKIQRSEDFHGYSGTICNIDVGNGLVAEIQINTPAMIYGKQSPEDAKKIIGEGVWNEIWQKTGIDGGLGHKFYEQIRVLDAIKDAEKIQDLIDQSTAYYKNFSSL